MNKNALKLIEELEKELTKIKPKETFSIPKTKALKNQNVLYIPQPKNIFSSLKPIATIPKKTSNLNKIFSRTKRVNWLNKKLKSKLGNPLSEQIELIAVNDSKIFIKVSNSSWGQRVKFCNDEIIFILNPFFKYKLKKVIVKIKTD